MDEFNREFRITERHHTNLVKINGLINQTVDSSYKYLLLECDTPQTMLTRFKSALNPGDEA